MKVAVVAIAGVLFFAAGAGLDHYATSVGIAGVNAFTNGFSTQGPLNATATGMAARSGEYAQIANILLWCGGAMIVLSAASWLFLCLRLVGQTGESVRF